MDSRRNNYLDGRIVRSLGIRCAGWIVRSLEIRCAGRIVRSLEIRCAGRIIRSLEIRCAGRIVRSLDIRQSMLDLNWRTRDKHWESQMVYCRNIRRWVPIFRPQAQNIPSSGIRRAWGWRIVLSLEIGRACGWGVVLRLGIRCAVRIVLSLGDRRA